MFNILYMEDDKKWQEEFKSEIQAISIENISLDLCENFNEAAKLIELKDYHFIVSDLEIKGELEGHDLIPLSQKKGIDCAMFTGLAMIERVKKGLAEKYQIEVFSKGEIKSLVAHIKEVKINKYQ